MQYKQAGVSLGQQENSRTYGVSNYYARFPVLSILDTQEKAAWKPNLTKIIHWLLFFLALVSASVTA